MRHASPALLARTVTAGLLALSALSAPAAAAQGASAGFETVSEPNPLALAPFSNMVRPLSNGELLTFDGRFVERRDAAGTPLATLLDVGQDVFGSFLLVAPDETFALLAESSLGNIYRIDLIAGTGALQDNVPFAFSAAFEPGGTVAISAATTSFANNDIVRLDISQPNAGFTLLANLPGPSGPLAILGNGDLIYGFPAAFGSTQTGTSDLVRFAASDLGVGLLFLSDSTPYATGFDGAGGLLYDAVSDTLFLAENNFTLGAARVRQVVPPFSGSSPVLYDDPFGRTVSFSGSTSPTAPGALLPYQPAEFSGSLTIGVTDFFSSDERLTLRSARPEAAFATPGAAGASTTDFTVSGAPANGFLVVAFGAGTGGPELPLPIPGFGPALFSGLDLVQVGLLQQLFSLDATGQFSVTVPTVQLPMGVSFQGLVYGGPPLAAVGTTTIAQP